MQPESVEVIQEPAPSGTGWNPVPGKETLDLLNHLGLPEDSKNNVLSQALGILGKCVSPTAPEGQRTGLVIGYVQSGKTMSFTTVTALARDNGYRMVIVLTGTSRPLLKQSTERLEKDLRLNERRDRKWKTFPNPSVKNELPSIQSALRNWNDPEVPEDERQTILITVIKNVTRVRDLTRLLRALKEMLVGAPVLIIDDEADQAGLNTKVNDGEQSATYRQLLALRTELPHFTYLQYTATPQAPLLINIIDVLSPSFVWVLTPGANYTGGKTFFVDYPQLIKIIPEQEIPGKDEALPEPPASLHRAMRLFFLGVAAGVIMERGQRENRSMMVHPSQDTSKHNDYHYWVDQARARWVSTLNLPPDDPDRIELVAEFLEAYDDLAGEVIGLPSFDDLMKRMPRAMRDTLITKVNSKQRGGTPPISWRHEYAHILVGGQALDRGFTVEGLTVTYMPRGVGVGNADTVQQRARFFGYKTDYLGFCRVFLNQDAADGFARYVEHEENIREQMRSFARSGRPLTEWKRAFFLDPAFRPTRAAVLDLELYRVSLSDGWYSPDSPHLPSEAITHNRQVVSDFLSTLTLIEAPGHHGRTDMQRHNVAVATLRHVYEELLTKIVLGRPGDSQRLTGILVQIEHYLSNVPDADCAIYEMSKGATRSRRVDDSDRITNLFSGITQGKSDVYPGDNKIFDEQRVTLQVHYLSLTHDDGRKESSEAIAEGVVAVAVRLPSTVAKATVVQEKVV